MKLNNILYIINFYGTPPLNYFEKYIKQETKIKLTIIKLPSVRPMKNRFLLDAFILYPTGKKIPFNISIWFPFSDYVVYALQYFINTLFLFYFLLRDMPKKYDLVIGETAYGSAVIFFIKKFGKAKYSMFMNGDILPDENRSTAFYFTSTRFKKITLMLDRIFVGIQKYLRNIGLKNDLIWYPNIVVKKWDESHKYFAKDSVVIPTVLLSSTEVEENIKNTREPHTIGYIGRLDEYAGVDMSLQVLSKLKSKIPDIKMILVGGGTATVQKYMKMAVELGVNDSVCFYGYVPDITEATKILSVAKLGLALYKPDKNNVSLFAEPAKPKDYLKLGIPPVLTVGGPQVSYDIKKYNAGLMCEYNPEDITQQVIQVLKDETVYTELQKGILDFAKTCDYKKAFSELLTEVEKRIWTA
jgi:glycosyltransferase involved in cell wall biosynthesis